MTRHEYEITCDWITPRTATALDGYHMSDFFLDRGACLHRTYRTQIEAMEAWNHNYLGRDIYGVGLRYEITGPVEVEDEP